MARDILRHLMEVLLQFAAKDGLARLCAAPERTPEEAGRARPTARAAWIPQTVFNATGMAGVPRTGRLYDQDDEAVAQATPARRIELTPHGQRLLPVTEAAQQGALASTA